jgi:hypothetical protein
MGCGASSTVTVPPVDAVNSQPKQETVELSNGHLKASEVVPDSGNRSQSFKPANKSNIVRPAPPDPSPPPEAEESHEVYEADDVLTVKRILKLSSIDETCVYGAKQNASCETSQRRWRKRLVDQRTQTEAQLFPEDELILMTCDEQEDDENHSADPEICDDDSDMHHGVSQHESFDEEGPSCHPQSRMSDVSSQTTSCARSKSSQTKLCLTATDSARSDHAATSLSLPRSTVRGEGRRQWAKRSPVIATQEEFSIGAETCVIPSNIFSSFARRSGKCPTRFLKSYLHTKARRRPGNYSWN